MYYHAYFRWVDGNTLTATTVYFVKILNSVGAHKQNRHSNMKRLLGKHLVKIIQKQQRLWRTAMLF
jgi:hypothetical protein